jgi:hypothetical protein
LYPQASWLYNYNYWSGGTKNQSSDAVWCPSSDGTPSGALKWEADKKETHHCMKMKIANNKTLTPWQMLWTYKNCSTLSLLACKVKQYITCSKTKIKLMWIKLQAPVTATPPPKCAKWNRDVTYF